MFVYIYIISSERDLLNNDSLISMPLWKLQKNSLSSKITYENTFSYRKKLSTLSKLLAKVVNMYAEKEQKHIIAVQDFGP